MWKFPYYDVDKGIDWEILSRECSWFNEMKLIPQDSIWHAEGNVQIHTKMVCEELMKLPEFLELRDWYKHILITSALMHDIEKRSTTCEDERDGRVCIVAPKHAQVGEKTARELLYKEFECPYHIREEICKLVKWHGKPLHDNSDREVIKLSTQVDISDLCMLSKADILGRICLDADEQLEKIEFLRLQAEDLGCLNNPKEFLSPFNEFHYLNNEDSPLEYDPYHKPLFQVIVMSGLPGSGKDTYIKNNLSNYPVISLDDIRNEFKVVHGDKKGQGRVIQEAKDRAKIFMRRKESFIWNSTNITKDMRSKVINLFLEYGAEVKIIHVEVPYKTLLKQNNSREDCIPKDAIDKMIRKWDPAVKGESHYLDIYVQ